MKHKMDQELLKSKLCNFIAGTNSPKIVKQKLSKKITDELINIIYSIQIEAVLLRSK